MIDHHRRAFAGGIFAAAILIATSAEATISERNQKLDAILADALPEIKAHWDSCRAFGLEAMTIEATDAVDREIVAYFARLKALGYPATDAEILVQMATLYKALNALNATRDYGLLETDERELLVPVFIAAAEACGIDSAKYYGEPGGEYRNF